MLICEKMFQKLEENIYFAAGESETLCRMLIHTFMYVQRPHHVICSLSLSSASKKLSAAESSSTKRVKSSEFTEFTIYSMKVFPLHSQRANISRKRLVQRFKRVLWAHKKAQERAWNEKLFQLRGDLFALTMIRNTSSSSSTSFIYRMTALGDSFRSRGEWRFFLCEKSETWNAFLKFRFSFSAMFTPCYVYSLWHLLDRKNMETFVDVLRENFANTPFFLSFKI